MTRIDRACTLCGSRSHNRNDCPWDRNDPEISRETAERLERSLTPESSPADTAARLINDIASPSKGSLQ